MLDYQYFSKIKKYRSEIITAGASTIGGVFIGKLADAWFSAPTVDQIIIGLLAIVALLIIGQMLTLKRNVIWRILDLNSRLTKVTGRYIISQYEERKSHFSEEKNRLIENLIRFVLPDTIKNLKDEQGNNITEIIIIVDSGTGLEQFFPRLKLLGLGPDIAESILKNLKIYTNSLSGSDEFCKTSANYLREEQLHLFGGTQIEKYRAVLGDVTQKAMKDVEIECKNKHGKIIGLITANWLLVGSAYDKLISCSTEIGHLNYKRTLAEISDILIVVVPLGKLLKIDTVDELNTILKLDEEGKPKYNGFEINKPPIRKKENTILLTTYRDKYNSILYRHSNDLTFAYTANKHQLYNMRPKDRGLILDHNCTYDDQIKIEMPHHYLHDHAYRALQILKEP